MFRIYIYQLYINIYSNYIYSRSIKALSENNILYYFDTIIMTKPSI